MNNKYSFEDWLNGSIILIHSSIFYNSGNTKKPIIVDYSDFYEEDAIKVKNHQRLLFQQRVKNLLSTWQEKFAQSHKTSERKEAFTANTIEYIEEILFGKKNGVHFTTFEPYNTTFQNSDLNEIRDYAANFITGGQEYNFQNVQIDNSKYIDTSKIQFELYAQALWEHLKKIKNISKAQPKVYERDWFKVGLLFANGEMDKLLEKYISCRKIAKEIGLENSRPYISESIANVINRKQNIFASQKKVDSIIEYCIQNEIPIVKSFYERKKSTRGTTNTQNKVK